MNNETRMYSLNFTDRHGNRYTMLAVGLESITKVERAPWALGGYSCK